MKTIKTYAFWGWRGVTAVVFAVVCVQVVRGGFGSSLGELSPRDIVGAVLAYGLWAFFALGFSAIVALPGAALGALLGWAVQRSRRPAPPPPAPAAEGGQVWPPTPSTSAARPRLPDQPEDGR